MTDEERDLLRQLVQSVHFLLRWGAESHQPVIIKASMEQEEDLTRASQCFEITDAKRRIELRPLDSSEANPLLGLTTEGPQR